MESILNKKAKTETRTDLPFCYLFSMELDFAKMERAVFAALKFCDLAKKYVKRKYFCENCQNTELH